MRGRRVLVVGLGRFGGGVGVTRWLAAQGAIVTVTDQADAKALADSVAAVGDLNVSLRLGGHDEHDLDHADLVIVNPAVDKAKSVFFHEVVRRGIPWTTEMNLFCERCPATVIGVTGTYGKSTTCAMLAEVYERARVADKTSYRAIHLGGNIGRSLMGELATMDERDLVVLEMSNAQLEDLPRIAWAPHVAVITNLHPHHLDRYASFTDYLRAKLNISCDPKRRAPVITGPMHQMAEAMLVAELTEWTDHSAGVRDRRVHVRNLGKPFSLRVPGSHNQANAACVLTVCETMGVDEALVRTALAEFRGLPHRLEFVRTLDGVDYYNDSKSTAPAATVVALEALDRPTVAIVGGQRKDVSLAECAAVLARRCRAVVCMGESGPAFAEALRSIEGSTPSIETVPSLVEAVPAARDFAHLGDVILFSPGAPSFDHYGNFTQRGQYFVEVVAMLGAARTD